MDITTFFTTFAIVGIALSAVLEVISRKFGVGSTKMKLISIGLALVLAGAYYFASNASWFPTFLTILGSASTFYAFVFNKK
jgi:hypothetical protein